jgi:hypothetical protein
MRTFKVHINSLYTNYLTDWVRDNHFQIMSTEVIPDVHAWKHKSEDLVLIHVDEAAMSIVEVDMNFWMGYAFSSHLVRQGVKPEHVL